jgi:hypothetical protein
MGDPVFAPPPVFEAERRWIPAAIAAAVIALLVILVLVFVRRDEQAAATETADPYASKLQIFDLKLSAAESFVGTEVKYLDGTITNAGDRTVSGVQVEVTFRNALNEVVQRDPMPLRLLETSGPYPDTVDFSASPLTPGQSKTFRLTFEHISADWNQAYPQIRIARVTLR